MGVDEVKEKWGCYPEDIAMIKAISGDSSDNIKGVKGVGQEDCHQDLRRGTIGCLRLIYEAQETERPCRHKSRSKPQSLVQLRNCLSVYSSPFVGMTMYSGSGGSTTGHRFLCNYELNSLAKRVGKTAEMMKLKG